MAPKQFSQLKRFRSDAGRRLKRHSSAAGAHAVANRWAQGDNAHVRPDTGCITWLKSTSSAAYLVRPGGAGRDSILSGAAFRILSGAAGPAPDEIYVKFFRAVPPAGQERSRVRIPPPPRAARRISSTTGARHVRARLFYEGAFQGNPAQQEGS